MTRQTALWQIVKFSRPNQEGEAWAIKRGTRYLKWRIGQIKHTWTSGSYRNATKIRDYLNDHPVECAGVMQPMYFFQELLNYKKEA